MTDNDIFKGITYDALEKQVGGKHYKNLGYIIPYFWMPKYVGASDSSARTLDIYN